MNGFPPARYWQALMGDAAKWTLTDALGVVDTRTDGAGYTDFLTTATAGTFFLTRPLRDFFGGPIDAANEAFTVSSLTTLANAGMTTSIRCLAGLSDNADPTAGGALYDVGGLDWWIATQRRAYAANETADAANSNFDADRATYSQTIAHGLTEQAAYAEIWDGVSTRASLRAQGNLPRAFVPTHLCVRINNVGATIRTIRAGVGFSVTPGLRDHAITPRV